MHLPRLSRRTLLRAGIASGFALTGAYGYEAARAFETVRLEVPITGLPRRAEGLRIGVLADFHAGGSLSPGEIAAAVAAINAGRPEVIALLGDYVDGRGADPDRSRFLFTALGHLQAPGGVFAVLGNHDHGGNAGWIRNALQRQRIVPLDNAGRRLAPGLLVAGVDDLLTGFAHLRRAMREAEAGDAVILLSHNPDINYEIRDPRIKLVLAGHTHGGQFRLPFLGWAPWIPCSERYHGPGGLIPEGAGRWTFISKGLGTHLVPVRIACPPDVAILTLRRA